MENKYDSFMEKCGINNDKLVPIEQDASSRKYFILKNNKNFLIMDSPHKDNNNDQFISISNYLNQINLSAPKVYKFDKSEGLMLIENFGINTFNKAIKNNTSELNLYKSAVDSLLVIHKSVYPKNISNYSKKILMSEVNLFLEWYYPYKNIKISKKEKMEWFELWNNYLHRITLENKILVLRDYHADNLFWLPNKKDNKKVGIIDFQDALIGNSAYDLGSLLEDVRRDLSDNTKKKVLEYFISKSKIKNTKNFYNSYNILVAQRNAKIAGIFVRLAVRDNKKKYLKKVNKAIKIFIEAAKKAELTGVLEWLGKRI